MFDLLIKFFEKLSTMKMKFKINFKNCKKIMNNFKIINSKITELIVDNYVDNSKNCG